MAHLGKRPFRLRSKAKLLEEYQKLDKSQSKLFYHEILDILKNSIVEGEGDNVEFRKYVELLESINKLEKTKRNHNFFIEGSWLAETNILLIVCQYERSEHLKLIISNHSNVLYMKSKQQLISPVDEDQYGKNAYYYLIRTSNVQLLEQLIETWPRPIENDQLDLALSKSYSRLVLQNVELSDNMKFYIEYTLAKLRLSKSILGNIYAPEPTLEEIKKRSRLITSTIDSLLDTYGSKSLLKVDEKFEFSLKFVILNMNILKRLLRCTYDRLPWEEMEFCLIILTMIFKSPEKSNFFYKSYIQKDNLLKFLKEFGINLKNVSDSLEEFDLSHDYINMDREAVVQDICERSTVFKELYEIHSKVRDYHTIETIVNQLSNALESDDLNDKLSDNFERDLIIQKCMLLVWESMKTSLYSPNLTIPLSNMLWVCFDENLQRILKHMESIVDNKPGVSLTSIIREHISSIASSLQEILSITTDIQNHMEFERIYDIIDECFQNLDLKNIENLKEILEIEKITAKNYIEKKIDIKMFVVRIQTELNEVMDSKLEYLLTELFDLIKHNEELIQVKNNSLEKFVMSANIPGNALINIKDMFRSKLTSNAEKLLCRLKFIGSSYQTKIMKNIDQIQHYITAKGCEHKSCITKLKYFVAPFLTVASCEDQISEIPNQKDTLKLVKKNIRESPCLPHILFDKIEKLKMILDRCGLVNDRTSLKHFILFKGRTETFSKVEMLLFDILTMLQDDLLPNAYIYNLPVPLLIGAELRNYLMWGNARNLSKILDYNIKLCMMVQCVMLVNQKSILTMTIKQLPFTADVESNLNYNIDMIEKKMEFFELPRCDKSKNYHDEYIDILSRNYDNLTYVHIAIQKGDINAMKSIIARGKKERYLLEDRNNRLKQNILHIAAQYCNVDDMKGLLKQIKNSKISLSQKDIESKIPLHYASCYAAANMIIKLLECYSNGIFAEDKKGYRPIHIAIISNNIPAFKVLLDTEKDINNKLGPSDQTLLHIAANAKCEDITKIIIDRGADIDLVNKNDQTPLHLACEKGCYNIVEMLVHNGSDINVIDKFGQTPICYAARERHLDIVKFLLINNADIHIKTELSVLHSAVLGGCSDIINEILRYGIDINIRSFDGLTPLLYAVVLNRLDAAKTLLQNGANVNIADDHNMTPLAKAITTDHMKIIELLLSYNSRWDIYNMFKSPAISKLPTIFSVFQFNNNPLLTLIFGNVIVLKLIMKKGVVLNNVENWEIAVGSESIETVRIIFDSCDPNYIRQHLSKLNDLLYTALRMGSGVIAKYLINLGATIDYSYDMLPCKTLQYATINFDTELVKFIVEKYVCQNRGDEVFNMLEQCWSLIAHSKGAVDLAKLFIKHGKTNTSQMILRTSVQSNNIEMIMVLIEGGLSIDLDSIFCAIGNGNTIVAKVLLEHSQIDINSKNSLNMTLLHIGAKHCDSSFIEYLVSKGAQVNSLSTDGFLPIEYAAMYGEHRSVEVLLKYGSKLGKSIQIALDMDNPRLMTVLIENNNDVDHIDENGSALHVAICENSESCSYLLLDSGKIDVNSLNPDKSTPLHLAAGKGNVLLTKILVAMNADIQKPDGKGNKPVQIAMCRGQIEIVAFYVEIKNKNLDDTLLHNVAHTNHIDIVQYLLGRKVDVNAKDGNGETALHIAARSSTWRMCRTLIENGAYYNIKNQNGMLPGDLATSKTKEYFVLYHTLFDMVENQRNASKISDFIELNQHKICLNTKGEDGRSLLHIAVAHGDIEVVQKLLRSNANVNVEDMELNTPLHYAAKSNNLRIVKALLSAGAKYNAKNIQNKPPHSLCNNPNVKHLLLTIDRCFKCVADENLQVCKIIEDAKDFEERKMIVFGARNDHNYSIYSCIIDQGLEDMENATDLILNTAEVFEWCTACKLMKAGRCEEACVHLRRIISKFESLYGKSNPLVLNFRKNFAYILHEMQQFKECLDTNLDLTKRLEEVYGEESNVVAKQRIFSIFLLSFLNENKKVISMMEKLSIKHLRTLLTANNDNENFAISGIFSQIGWYNEALTINTDFLEARPSEQYANDTVALEALSKRAHIFIKQKSLSEAYNLQNFVCVSYHDNIGPTQSFYFSALKNLSAILFEMGHINEYSKMLENLCEICERSRGSHDPQTLKMNEKLMYLYIEKSDYEAAKNIFDNIYPELRKLRARDVEEQIRLHALQGILSVEVAESSSRSSEKSQQKRQIWRHGVLFRAISDGDTERVSKILQTDKTLINGVDKNGATPLHLAANMNNPTILELLIKTGANVFASTKNGNSILHTAANKGSILAVKTIFDHINQKFGEKLYEFVNRKTIRGGKTALHVAAEQGFYEICIYLLQNGAIYNSLTKDNKRPIDLAKLQNIKNLFIKINTLFQYIDTIDQNFEQLLQESSEDEQKAYKCCRNSGNQTLLEYATANEKFKILNAITNLLKK